jgi:ATP-dependent phosphoenolpyruvate carboxykinase
MKKVIALLILVAGLSQGFAQNAKKLSSGDDELDKSIMSLTKLARKDAATFQAALISRYAITEAQAKDYYGKYSGGDLFMVFETAKETGKTPADVFTVYDKNRATGSWEATLKELGVKTKSFDAIKTAVVNNGID